MREQGVIGSGGIEEWLAKARSDAMVNIQSFKTPSNQSAPILTSFKGSQNKGLGQAIQNSGILKDETQLGQVSQGFAEMKITK